DGFLLNRESYFHGIYQWAFYVHIITAPVALILGSLLFVNGKRFKGFQSIPHRTLGKIQVPLVLCGVVPSGIVMSFYAAAGWQAGVGLFLLALATAGTFSNALLKIRQRNYLAHQRWATRCFILLLSPLFLRIVNGFFFLFQIESPIAYQINSWASWLVPLMAYEVVLLKQSVPHFLTNQQLLFREAEL
ncbi:MAG: DUF2306 domain-containing protein, partial [Planctomycetota bacterium]